LIAVVIALALSVLAPSASALGVTWLEGYPAPGTPEQLNKVGVIKIGAKNVKNVLVLEAGAPAGAGYFIPLAQWVAEKAHGWQVWIVERRQNLLEDHSEFDLAKEGKASAAQMFDYYLGYLVDHSVTTHIEPVKDEVVLFARQWGMRVAVEDLRRVVAAAKRRGGKVVLGGHSLGGSIATAYATWDFNGKPGANLLSGLVYDDGGSSNAPLSAMQATESLQRLKVSSPWAAFNGIAAPQVGLFSSILANAAQDEPNAPSVVQDFFLRPAALRPPVSVTNLAMLGYATDTQSSQLGYSSQAHLGQLDTSTNPAGWNGAGALTPLDRYASMLSGAMNGVDGTEWYFPQRLLIDSEAIDGGNANPAQSTLGLRSTLGHALPKSLQIYAFGAYHGKETLDEAMTLARQSHIPKRNLTLVDRQSSYAHNDPAGAYPNNDFAQKLVRFLGKIRSFRGSQKR
jgi:pimeloyl-ACP methyl ester carboxylesterase